MALTTEEQELYDFAADMLPKLFFSRTRSEEELNAFVKTFDGARAQILAFFQQALILNATNVPPDFLDQHARDRGTARQEGETDAALRERLRNVEDALVRSVLLSLVQAILTAEAIAGAPAMVEFRYERAFFRSAVADTGVGGEFFGTPPDMEFLPNTPFARGINVITTVSRLFPRLLNPAGFAATKLVVSGAASAGNDGTFDITGLNGDRAQFQNASGVVGADATVAWTQQAVDYDGNVLDGFKDSYLSRGFRLGLGQPPHIAIILPFGSTAATAAGVLEALRLKKAAGVVATVEYRQSP